MRKLLLASAVAAMSGSAMLAVAAGPEPVDAEAKAYMTYAFGGMSKPVASRFHYGLRMDYNRPYSMDVRPPLLHLDFDRNGLTQTRINGLSVVQRLALNQDETAPAEEPAPEAPADTASSESSGEGESSGESSGEGEVASGTQYTILDWGLIAVGAVGIGFVAAETLDTEESPEPPPADNGGDDDGGGLLGVLLGLSGQSGDSNETGHEYQLWLDGGTGQMGDLGG